MLGRPQPDYVKTLAKALAIRQRYLPHISSTGTVRPEIKSVLINGDQSGASSDQQETDITVLTNQDIQTITLSLNGVSLPNITVQPNVNHRYDFKVTLSQAVNTLQVTVVDAAGTPSFTTEKVVRYTGRPLDADLYVLAVGVSDYQQSEYDLTFADKDALDFIKLYGGLADTEYKQYEDKFFGTRYQLIKNEPNEISSEIRDFRAYSAVTGLIPVDPRGEKWLEIHGDKALLWDFNTASKKEIRLPSKFRTEAIYGVNELLYIEPEGNGFYCRTDDSLHYYSFRTDSLYTHSSPFTANAWAALSRPILLNGGRWVYAEQHPLYRGWEAVDSITVHIATNDKEKWKEQTHHFVLPGSLMPTLQTATSSGDNLLFSTVADTAIYAEWNENVYHARKIPIPKQIEYGDILNISEKKQQISLLRHYFTEADEKNAKEENGYHHYTFDLSGKLQDSLQLSDNDYATKGIQMIDGNLYKIATLPPMAVSRNLFSANEDTLIANAGPASFAHIHTRYLVNEQATDTAIRESLQSFFRTTKPADQVVIFLAGHGVLDSAYNFHYAAHNMDFSRVRTHGVALQEIIEEISKSSANRKLLMIDACHSGNVFEHIDIDTTHMTAGQSGERGSKAIRSQTAGQIDVATVINTMFDNFTSSSGLTILSASAGTDVAYENPSLSNGAFTTAFLNTLINELKHGRILLDTSTLDQPVILTDPLINRIQKEVIQVTNRKQTPDIREINSDVQIAIW